MKAECVGVPHGRETHPFLTRSILFLHEISSDLGMEKVALSCSGSGFELQLCRKNLLRKETIRQRYFIFDVLVLPALFVLPVFVSLTNKKAVHRHQKNSRFFSPQPPPTPTPF